MSHQCPTCKRVLYNRRLKICGFCGATVPEDLRFSPEEVAKLDRWMTALVESRKRREMIAEEEARAAAAQAQTSIIIPIIMSS